MEELKAGVLEVLDKTGGSVYEGARALLDIERDRIWDRAQQLQARFMTEFEYARANFDASDQPRYGFKAEWRGEGGISLRWISLNFHGPKNARRVTYRHVPRGKDTFRYKIALFDKARAWERVLIQSIEAEAEPLRRQLESLGRLSRTLYAYGVLTGTIPQPSTPPAGVDEQGVDAGF